MHPPPCPPHPLAPAGSDAAGAAGRRCSRREADDAGPPQHGGGAGARGQGCAGNALLRPVRHLARPRHHDGVACHAPGNARPPGRQPRWQQGRRAARRAGGAAGGAACTCAVPDQRHAAGGLLPARALPRGGRQHALGRVCGPRAAGGAGGRQRRLAAGAVGAAPAGHHCALLALAPAARAAPAAAQPAAAARGGHLGGRVEPSLRASHAAAAANVGGVGGAGRRRPQHAQRQPDGGRQQCHELLLPPVQCGGHRPQGERDALLRGVCSTAAAAACPTERCSSLPPTPRCLPT